MNSLEKFDAHMQAEEAFAPCWIVADKAVGMMMQSIAMAESLGFQAPIFKVTPTPILRAMPQLARVPGWPIVMGRRPDFLKGPLPKLLITTGRRMAGFSIGMRRLSRGATKTIHIQDARLDPNLFDALVVPAHDPIARTEPRPDNLIISKGALNRLTKDTIAEAAADLPERYHRLKGRKFLVMLGGKNKRYNPTAEDFVSLGDQLHALSQKQAAQLIIVPSSRTPKAHLAALMGRCNPARTHLWDGQDPNPYPGLLGLVDAVVVTSDSVNMVSEATITGKPVLIAELQPETGRIAMFLQRFIDDGHVARLCADDKLKAPVPLDEMAEIARQVKRRIGDLL